MPDTATTPEKAGFDSCIFIELLQRQDATRLDACDALSYQAQSGSLVIVATTVAVVEVNRLSDDERLREDECRTILNYFRNPYITLRPNRTKFVRLV